MNYSFIVIDDGELDCFIVKRIIKLAFPNLEITAFTDASPALDSIRDKKPDFDNHCTIVLLDLNMPVMNGFQFLEEFEKLPLAVQKSYKINVLSSTKNQTDINHLNKFKSINSFIEKPLNKDKVLSLMDEVQNRVEK
jgi:CheY-like chemotaxis protein